MLVAPADVDCAFIEPDPTALISVMRIDIAGVPTGIRPWVKTKFEGAELAILQGAKNRS